MTEQAERSAVGTEQINAPVDRVWRALTEAAELERWFPLEARVEPPGEGGRIFMGWGNEFAEWSTIEAWDAPNHLRISWGWGDEQTQVTDYWLEAEGGGTRMRVVTSGFPADSTWDDMVEGTRVGWLFELRQLRHYLERHDGEPRRAVFNRRRIGAPRAEAWERLMAALEAELPAAAVFDRTAEYQLAFISTSPSDGLVRFTVDPMHGDPDHRSVGFWVSAWGDAREEVAPAAARWTDLLARTFPEGEPLEAEAGT